MKRIKLILLAGLLITLALVSTASATVTIVNFDNLVGGGASSYLPVGYAGLNWDPHWFYWDWAQPPFNAHSPSTRIATDYYGGWIGFNNPVDFKGAWFSGVGTDHVYFEGYKNGVKIGQSATLTLSGTPTFLNAGFSTAVDKVVVVCDNWNYFCVDDITYDTSTPPASVPEFPSLALPATMIIGFLGAVLLIQRTRDH